MTVRDKVAANAAPHLKPGETVQGVVCCQTASWYLILFGVLLLYPLLVVFLAMNHYRTVVATDRRILVLDSGRWNATKVKGVLLELPRTTKLGPWTGNLWHKARLGTETLRIHRRFKDDVGRIDRG